MTDNNNLFEELDRLAGAALGQPPALGPIAHRGDERTVAVYLDDARSIQAVNEMPKGETRMLGFKRSIMRFGQLYLHRQARYNASMVEAVAHLNDQVALLRASMGTELSRTAAAMASLDASLDELDERVAAHAGSEGRQAALHDAHLALRGAVDALRADVDRAVNDIRSTMPPALSEETARAIAQGASGRADAFYERFEDAMRGSADAVRAMLEPYLADLEVRRSLGGPIIDIGCGRGEWLELLAAKGFDTLGIDTNGKAIELCVSKGLNAIEGDAIAYLNNTTPSSVMAVTGFHIVEHLPADVQIALVEAALRALKPGGILILETPNPTNLNVGAASFYSDPTHLRPVNPGYLAFLFGDVGFVGVETRFLHPRSGFEPSTSPNAGLDDELMWAIRGPQDFAVIGRKPADLPDHAS